MNKENEFILKLTKETLRKNIEWTDKQNKGLVFPHEERATSKLYLTTIGKKKFRIYEFEYKHYINEDESLWDQRVRFEMIDSNEEKIYEFGYNYSLNDLFNAVTKSNSGVDEFLDKFLK
jgi:hypothetical protein